MQSNRYRALRTSVWTQCSEVKGILPYTGKALSVEMRVAAAAAMHEGVTGLAVQDQGTAVMGTAAQSGGVSALDTINMETMKPHGNGLENKGECKKLNNT